MKLKTQDAAKYLGLTYTEFYNLSRRHGIKKEKHGKGYVFDTKELKPFKKFYSVRDVAKKLNMSRQNVHLMLKSGRLKGTQLRKNAKWFIFKSSVDKQI